MLSLPKGLITMPAHRILSLHLCLFMLIALNGCVQVKEERKHRLLESATSGYRQAIRWGYHDAAVQFIDPEARPEDPLTLFENIRVTSYETVRPPIVLDDDKAEQLVRIEYVQRDRQRMESLADRQQWRYDEQTSSWWLTSGLPAFKTD